VPGLSDAAERHTYSTGLAASAAGSTSFPAAADPRTENLVASVRRVAFVAQFVAARAERDRAGQVAVLLPAVTAHNASQTSAGARACEYPPP